MNRIYRTIASAALMALLTTGCGNSLGPELFDYARALDRWQDRGLDDYSFEYRLSCFCGLPANRRVLVHVVDDQVESAEYIEDGENVPVPADQLRSLSTIDGLFDRIARTLERNPERFEAEYDPDWGYPRSVSADIAFNISDEEFSFEVALHIPFSSGQIRRD